MKNILCALSITFGAGIAAGAGISNIYDNSNDQFNQCETALERLSTASDNLEIADKNLKKQCDALLATISR